MSEKAPPTVLLVTGPATGGIRSHVRLLERHLPRLGYALCVAGPRPTTDDRRPATNDQRPTTNDQRPTTSDQRPATNDQRTTTNEQRPTTNEQRTTAEGTPLAALPATGVQPVVMLPPAAHLLPLTDRFASALSPRVIGRLVAIRRQCAARIVHAHGYKAGVAAAVALAVAARRVPLVVTIHNLWPAAASGAARAALRFVARRAALIAVSEAVAESIRRVLPHAAVTVIGNGIEIDEFQDGDGPAVRRELGIPPDATLIGYFGRLTREKGADLALAAISILASRRPEARLLVAGDGPERAALEGTAGPEVCFLGERSDVPTLLAACDAVLIPSRAEGQSLVALEAMAAGRPIVAADVGGLGAMVRAIGGPVTPTEDPAAMARAIERLLADDDLRAGLIARGRAYVAEHASADCTAAAVAAVYDRLLGRKRC